MENQGSGIIAGRTTRSAVTSERTIGTALKSTVGGRRGTLLLSQTCSTDVRNYTTTGHPCEATNRRVDIECEDPRGRCPALHRSQDPKQRANLWTLHSESGNRSVPSSASFSNRDNLGSCCLAWRSAFGDRNRLLRFRSRKVAFYRRPRRHCHRGG
jgi:hypothetical protein